jgi:hypothetical protein
MTELALLDTLGIINGTDKSSLRWDYLRQYEEVFLPWRDAEFNLIEIGVGGGGSLRTWLRFFTRATIVGIDIDERARRAAEGRVVIEIGSQIDGGFLDAVMDKYPPGIVIDDGSHQGEHIMFTFRKVFPRLASGGWYAVEDLSITSGLESLSPTPHQYFARTAQAIMHRRPGDHPEPGILDEIDRIDFSPGMTFVRKRNPVERRRRIENAVDVVRKTINPNNFLWLSRLLVTELADLDRAEVVARKAVELHRDAAVYHLGLSDVLERKGDLPGAMEAALTGAVAEPGNFQCHLRVAELRARSGKLAEAATSLEFAANTAPAELSGHIQRERARILVKLDC